MFSSPYFVDVLVFFDDSDVFLCQSFPQLFLEKWQGFSLQQAVVWYLYKLVVSMIPTNFCKINEKFHHLMRKQRLICLEEKKTNLTCSKFWHWNNFALKSGDTYRFNIHAIWRKMSTNLFWCCLAIKIYSSSISSKGIKLGWNIEGFNRAP